MTNLLTHTPASVKKQAKSWLVVRRTNGPLHIATATGRGYITICGHALAGADLEVPMPRWPASPRSLNKYWGRLWALELTCIKCRKQVGR